MAPSWFQLLIVLLLIVLLFGRGKISEVMGDFAKGIKSFKRGLNDDTETAAATDRKAIEDRPGDKMDARASSRENMHAG
ncbi:MAG: twin-arginine translocase TatA/TatE family subunit [Rhodomicrobium sp.]|nr:twin-arginine translocase TatA/TatE family subunit [Rhodomicrobium sp.]